MTAARALGGAGLALGTRRGIAACASARGTFAVLALDHRQNLRKELRPDDPALGHLRRDGRVQAGRRPGPRAGRDRDAARPGDRGGPVHRGRLAAGVGRACSSRSRRPATSARPRRGSAASSTGWSVEQAKRMGASAAKLLVYYHPEASNADAQERSRRRRRGGLPGGGPRALRRAAVVLAGRGRAAGRRGTPARRRGDRAADDRDRRRHPQGRVPVRPLRHGPGALARGLRGARRGLRRAVGAAVGRRRRRDVRGAGRDRVPGRSERRAGRPVRLGRGRQAGARRPRRVPRDDRRAPGSAGSSSWPTRPAGHGTTARTG